MKYGESIFDIAYLLFAIISGCLILHRAKDETEKMMGCAALILGMLMLPKTVCYIFMIRSFLLIQR